jgi:hypothetical protein
MEITDHDQGMLTILKEEYPNCGIIYIIVDPKAGANAVWSGELPPLGVGGTADSRIE